MEIKALGKGIGIGLMALGAMVAPLASASAEGEGMSLKEMLLEKGILTQDEAAAVHETKLSRWVEQVTLSGDLRLRHESIEKDPGRDRHRERFRLRLGPEIKIGDFVVGIRLASGTGEHNSTNQSFDGLGNQKGVWIDRAYLRWQGAQSRWLTLTGGRMPNPFFTVYSTDAMWDDDFNPEGYAENFRFTMGEHLSLFFNAGQIVLDEDSKDNNDQWLFGEQIGVHLSPAKDVTATLAVAHHDFTNSKEGDFGQGACNKGNARSGSGCGLVNDYRILDVTAQLGLKVGGLPLSIMGDYVKNMADPDEGTPRSEETGYQAGFIFGKAGDPNTWEAAYFYKRMETEATVADLSDSDFGEGGLDRKGHILWGAYSFTNRLQAKTKFFHTQRESETDDPKTQDDIDRIQVDFTMRF